MKQVMALCIAYVIDTTRGGEGAQTGTGARRRPRVTFNTQGLRSDPSLQINDYII